MKHVKVSESKFSELKDRQDLRNEKILKSINLDNPNSDNNIFGNIEYE